MQVVNSPFGISGAAGLDFSGVFENAGDVSVHIQGAELFVYDGQRPQAVPASPITFFPGGTLPARGALAFKLETIMEQGDGSSTRLQWHVAVNSGSALYFLSDAAGGGYCGQVPEGKALTW